MDNNDALLIIETEIDNISVQIGTLQSKQNALRVAQKILTDGFQANPSEETTSATDKIVSDASS